MSVTCIYRYVCCEMSVFFDIFITLISKQTDTNRCLTDTLNRYLTDV